MPPRNKSSPRVNAFRVPFGAVSSSSQAASGPLRPTVWYDCARMALAVSTNLLEGLREDLGQRRIGSGTARLDDYWERVGRFDPQNPDAAGILCYVAQW